MASLYERLLIGGEGSATKIGDIGLLVMRLGFGLIMALNHGLSKIPPADGFVDGVAKMGFFMPQVFAWAAGLTEFVGALLIAAGLLTRPASAVFDHHDGRGRLRAPRR